MGITVRKTKLTAFMGCMRRPVLADAERRKADAEARAKAWEWADAMNKAQSAKPSLSLGTATAGSGISRRNSMPKACQTRHTLPDGAPAQVTPRELAVLTGSSEACIRRMCERGDLPAYKVGKRWYINRVRLMVAAL